MLQPCHANAVSLLLLVSLRPLHSLKYCTVCQDGSEILNPHALIEETDQTCAELSEEARHYEDPIACRYYHRYGGACGCNNVAPSESFCALCQEETDQIGDETLWLDGYDASCGTLQIDAAWNLWGTFSADEDANINIDQDNCDYYHHAGGLCGCKHNRPPEKGCTLCSDGSQPMLLDKTVIPNHAAEETCEVLSLFTQYQTTQGTSECQATQAVGGSYCGCSDTSTPAKSCDICPQGLVIREGWAPDVEFAANNRVFYFHDASCIKVAMLASTFGFPCGSAPRDYIEACCQAATELLGPEVFVQSGTSDAATSHSQGKDDYEINWDEFTFFSAATTSWNQSFAFALGIVMAFLA